MKLFGPLGKWAQRQAADRALAVAKIILPDDCTWDDRLPIGRAKVSRVSVIRGGEVSIVVRFGLEDKDMDRA